MPLFFPPLDVQSDGIDLGKVTTINFTTGVAISVSGTTATVMGTGTVNLTETTVDFGETPTNYKIFTIINSSVNSSSAIMAVQSGNAPIGRSIDENEMDPIIFVAISGNGSFTLIATTLNGPVVGAYKVIYIVS